MILGCHVSYGSEQILGSVKQAIEYGANTFMFYTGAPQNTLRKSLDKKLILKAHELMKEEGIDISNVVCHAPYIINLANKKDLDKWKFSIEFLKKEILRCEEMGITKIVVHPGSAVSITHEEGIQNIIEALNLVVREDQTCLILLETMAGKGSECACTLEEIKTILGGVLKEDKFGVCLDTCHLHDAGYHMDCFSDFLREFDQLIGLDKILCVHVNDSKNDCGAHKDRHENIGYGKIGFSSLSTICSCEQLKKVPKILETPYIGNTFDDKLRLYPPYRFEITMLQNNVFNEHLYEDIRGFYKKD